MISRVNVVLQRTVVVSVLSLLINLVDGTILQFFVLAFQSTPCVKMFDDHLCI